MFPLDDSDTTDESHSTPKKFRSKNKLKNKLHVTWEILLSSEPSHVYFCSGSKYKKGNSNDRFFS